MPSFRDHRLRLTRDTSFITPILNFLKTEPSYKSFSLEKMAINTEGGILIPLYATEEHGEGIPDGYALMQKAPNGWIIAGVFKNPEPQVL
jgi:hypothetical protein